MLPKKRYDSILIVQWLCFGSILFHMGMFELKVFL